MKISSSLHRTIKLVIERSNAESKRQCEAKIDEAIQKLRKEKHLDELLKNHKAISRQLDQVENQIEDAGFNTDGTAQYEVREALNQKFKAEKINMDEVLALLATSDEAKGKKILQGLGIQW
jgi:predicted transcriptional regulator